VHIAQRATLPSSVVLIRQVEFIATWAVKKEWQLVAVLLLKGMTKGQVVTRMMWLDTTISLVRLISAPMIEGALP